MAIPAFDLYNNDVGDRNRREKITTYAYDNKTAPKNADILKFLL